MSELGKNERISYEPQVSSMTNVLTTFWPPPCAIRVQRHCKWKLFILCLSFTFFDAWRHSCICTLVTAIFSRPIKARSLHSPSFTTFVSWLNSSLNSNEMTEFFCCFRGIQSMDCKVADTCFQYFSSKLWWMDNALYKNWYHKQIPPNHW